MTQLNTNSRLEFGVFQLLEFLYFKSDKPIGPYVMVHWIGLLLSMQNLVTFFARSQ